MKKYFYLAAAAIALVACNNEKLENGSVQELKSISLTASINSSVDVTRASSADALQNTQFVADKTIFVEVYETGEATTYTTGEYTTAAEGALTGNLYYPSNNNHVDICAYYPSTISSASTEFTVSNDQSSEAAYQASDLMFATKLTDKGSGATHDLTFNHALTKIVVNIEYAENMITTGLTTTPAITDVKLNSTVRTASLTISEGAITAGKKAEVDASDIDIMGTGFDNTGIIVPQTVAADIPFVTLTYNSATYIYKLPSATNFLAGKVYTYTLTLSARGLELSAISINDWIGEDAEHNPLGGSENITI